MRKLGWCTVVTVTAAVACSHAPVQTGTAPSPAITKLASAPTTPAGPNAVENAVRALPGWQPLNPPTGSSTGSKALEKLIEQTPGYLPLDPSR